MATTPLAFPDPSEPLLAMSALEQAALVRDGSVSSRELVELYLGRIARHDPKVAAFVLLFAEEARREAEQADRLRKRGGLLPPFLGVPTAVKDLHFVRNSRTRMGSRAWRFLWSPFDDQTVAALRRAGFVITGKTSTSELALLPIVETDLHPPTRNPWDPARTAGGSSGGAAAALAAGLTPIAPGSDGAGSVRIPSALCGVVGLKPSRGLVPDTLGRIDHQKMTSIGPMGRSVEDVAALLDVLARRERGGPGSFHAASLLRPARLKVGLIVGAPIGEVHPGIAAAVRDAAKLLGELGHEVVERPVINGTLEEFLPIYQRLFVRVPVPFEAKLQPVTRWFREEGRRRSDAEAAQAFQLLGDRARSLFTGVDVLLTPTTPVLPPAVGAFAGLSPAEYFAAAAPLGALTAAWNITGLPALSLPWQRVEKLPAAVQLIGRAGTDGELLALAAELVKARAEG